MRIESDSLTTTIGDGLASRPQSLLVFLYGIDSNATSGIPRPGEPTYPLENQVFRQDLRQNVGFISSGGHVRREMPL
jgi:hypothetical protein